MIWGRGQASPPNPLLKRQALARAMHAAFSNRGAPVRGGIETDKLSKRGGLARVLDRVRCQQRG